MMEFEKFAKIARLNREIVITEKIDGTNAQVYIMPMPTHTSMMKDFEARGWPVVKNGDYHYAVMAGSRNRWLSAQKDNFGFARWVLENIQELMKLGVGRHYGEWWGQSIQRGYDMDGKVFSLFNTGRWNAETKPDCCGVVPVLYEGDFSEEEIKTTLGQLKANGSEASPGFEDPEGIVIFHSAASRLFKVTIKDDESPKSKIIE